ncbi:MAG: hypothetical protein JXR68_12140 [Bacteroidales bacterium]|nr:hypothetical protein [Bacteroidales bacterium]
MITSILLIGSGLYFLPKLLNLSKTAIAADKIEFNPVGVKWSGFSGTNLNFTIKFSVVNPSKTNILIQWLFFRVFIDKNELITKDLPTWNKEIKGEQENLIQIPVSVTLLSAIKILGISIVNLFKNDAIPEHVRIAGYVKAADFTVDFDKIVNVSDE